jgi:hypothetical protein
VLHVHLRTTIITTYCIHSIESVSHRYSEGLFDDVMDEASRN